MDRQRKANCAAVMVSELLGSGRIAVTEATGGGVAHKGRNKTYHVSPQWGSKCMHEMCLPNARAALPG